MQHLNVQCMKKHTLGFTWHSKVVTAIKLKMKLKQNKTKTNKNNYSELNQLVSKKKKSSEYVLEARNVFFHFINTSNR